MKGTKTVAVDLIAASRKRPHSPGKTTLSRCAYESGGSGNSNHLEFSFSKQKSQEDERSNDKDKVSRALFEAKKKARAKPGVITTGQKTNASYANVRIKEESGHSPKRKSSNNDRLFKKSVDKLKKTFFNGVRNNKALTIKTLEQIGKNAKRRTENMRTTQREYQIPSKQKMKQRNIPVQFYGCDPYSQKSFYSPKKIQKNVVTNQVPKRSVQTQFSPKYVYEQKGTYFNFEQEWRKQLPKTQKEERVDRYPSTYSTLPASDKLYSNYTEQPMKEDSTLYSPSQRIQAQHEHYSPSANDSINEEQIDTICQIFELCQKYNQGDKLTQPQFYRLLSQLERLYFVKVIQQSQSSSERKTQKVYSSDFNLLLKKFQESIKVVFYRKQACDIYDCLYYLKASDNLDKACSLFKGIKDILELQL